MSSYAVTTTVGGQPNQPNAKPANNKAKSWLCCSLLLCFLSQQAAAQHHNSLHQWIEQSQRQDPWLKQNTHLQAAQLSAAASANALPNMRFSVGINNVATDGFDFNQEPMSHLKIGLSQAFNRGDSSALNQQQHQQLAAARPWLAEARQASLARQVVSQVLLIKQAQNNITLNQQNQRLTEDLLHLTEASYQAAFGSTQQQDLIEAQLALIDQQDQQEVFAQQQATHVATLSALLPESLAVQNSLLTALAAMPVPHIQLLEPLGQNNTKPELDWQWFTQHPSILAHEQQLQAAATQVELAEQQNKPALTLSTAYGYRADSIDRIHRADLFSVSLSFDLPSMNKSKIRHTVLQRAQQLDALGAAKNLQLQQMQQACQELLTQHQSLLRRITLHRQQLIPQRQQLAETHIKAYSHEGGDFAAVMRAQMAAVDAQITLNQLQTELAMTTLDINYLLMHSSQQFIHAIQSTGGSHD